MAVDFEQPPVALIIHGVQTGDDNDMRQHTHVEANLRRLLENPELHEDDVFPFSTDIFKYEDINDDAAYLVRRVLATLTGNSIAGWVVDKAADLVGDVLIALTGGDTYDEIKQGFTAKIEEIHDTGRPVYIVAHSLGSFYAHEVLNDMFAAHRFAKSDKAEWPVPWPGDDRFATRPRTFPAQCGNVEPPQDWRQRQVATPVSMEELLGCPGPDRHRQHSRLPEAQRVSVSFRSPGCQEERLEHPQP